MKHSLHLPWFVFVMLFSISSVAHAVIYLDEDFEGGSVFVDRGFAVIGESQPPTLPLVTGINLRANDNSLITPPVEIGSNQGSVTASRAYSGNRSYRLGPGQRLAVTPGAFPGRNLNWFHVWQFAVSADPASAALPQGTRAGYFQIDYRSDSDSNLVPDVSILLALRANGSGGVDLVCENNQRKLGALSGAPSDWLLVTVVSCNRLSYQSREDAPVPWYAYDPITHVFKGPQPNPSPSQIPTGISIYVNKKSTSKTTVSNLKRDPYLGFVWGNEEAPPGVPSNNVTSEIGWAFQAENGGVFYVDDLFWQAGCNNNDNGLGRESAARMTQFATDIRDAALNLTSPSDFADGKFGHALSQVPDVSGDGIADMIVGAFQLGSEPYSGTPQVGRAFVMNAKTGDCLTTLTSLHPEAMGHFGYAVCGLPDISGDGLGDVAVGAPQEDGDPGFQDSGRVYFFNGANGQSLRVLTSNASSSGGKFGYSLSLGADFNENGVRDLIIGAPGESLDQMDDDGKIHVVDPSTGQELLALQHPSN